MASGHANRANRPNTWLHRPATRPEVFTCQPGAVHTWHEADQIDKWAKSKGQRLTLSRHPPPHASNAYGAGNEQPATFL
jgi:hypothetical protein